MNNMPERHDIVIIGGGPAGLAAAIGAYEAGCKDVLVLERDTHLGGILNQCIHNGFGLHTFGEELTGPEYATRYMDKVAELGIECRLDTMVIDISDSRIVTAVSEDRGIHAIEAGAVVLAMGCRERPRGALNIPGFRPAGVYTAGTAQRLVNIEGQMPGRDVVVLGSGDIGLIMARRMTLEGARVHCVAELMPYSGGLKRNIVQCLDDYGIPLLLSHTVTRVEGKKRVEAVWVGEVDENLRPIPGTEVRYPCDTLLLSVGLLPENELSRAANVSLSGVTRGPVVDDALQTNVDGVFACGNVLHVHDLVDYVSEEAELAGRSAARFVRGERVPEDGTLVSVEVGDGVRYTVPTTVCPQRMDEKLTVRFRVGNVYRDRYVSMYVGEDRVLHRKKRVLAPGEMEEVVLKRKDLEARPDASRITITLEEE
jgi:NADPH-dependent 2,4-dienoyl-CoA reductase/sulfur reductase-like enzyme